MTNPNPFLEATDPVARALKESRDLNVRLTAELAVARRALHLTPWELAVTQSSLERCADRYDGESIAALITKVATARTAAEAADWAEIRQRAFEVA